MSCTGCSSFHSPDLCQYINDLATGSAQVAAALADQNISNSQRLTAWPSDRYAAITGLPYHAGSVTDDMTYYHAFNEIDPNTTAAIIEAAFMNMDYQFITEETENTGGHRGWHLVLFERRGYSTRSRSIAMAPIPSTLPEQAKARTPTRGSDTSSPNYPKIVADYPDEA